MRNAISVLAVAFITIVSCTKFDDTALWQAINKHTEEIAALKEQCNNLNSDIESLRQIVKALQDGDYITDCVPLADNSGYTIIFKSGKSIVIKNGIDGKDGKDGSTPQIGIDKYTDGVYYWTLNGEWLLDKNGNMVKAEGVDGQNGSDGMSPKLKIEEGFWYISTDNGVTWTKLGKATGNDGKDGETLFKSVTPGENCIVFILSDGTEIQVPYYNEEAKLAVTGEYTDLSSNSVNVYGWSFHQKDEPGLSAVYGIEYSSSNLTTPQRQEAKSKDSSNKFCCQISELHYNTQYYYRAYVYFNGIYSYGEVKSFTTLDIAIPELVDLGLSVKWASFNLGAEKPEDRGGYYQWGGLLDVCNTSIYLYWDNCPYHNGSSAINGWTKYNSSSSYGTVDNKTVLEPGDDIAHVTFGGKWRMPTDSEWAELVSRDNCTWVWGNVNGVNGSIVTSLKPGYTNSSIFLPAVGIRTENKISFYNIYGYYWSSTLDDSYPHSAESVWFDSIKPNHNTGSRCDGMPIRPVSD